MVPKEKKKKSGKLFCGNGIAEIEGKKTICHIFFPSISAMLLPLFFFSPSISALQIFLEMIRTQYFYNFFTKNSKWQVVTDCYYWDKKVILVLGSNLNQ